MPATEGPSRPACAVAASRSAVSIAARTPLLRTSFIELKAPSPARIIRELLAQFRPCVIIRKTGVRPARSNAFVIAKLVVFKRIERANRERIEDGADHVAARLAVRFSGLGAAGRLRHRRGRPGAANPAACKTALAGRDRRSPVQRAEHPLLRRP